MAGSSSLLFNKILIANRSEIAVRIINACRSLNIPTVAVYSEADKYSKHKLMADEAVLIGPPPPKESYLDIGKIIEAAQQVGADAIHPGYGFLSENPALAEACTQNGITFIGPSPSAIRLLGNKVESRRKMAEARVPLIPGMKDISLERQDFRDMAKKVGYPVLIKAAAGGGGKGMRIVNRPEEMTLALDAATREAQNAFGDGSLYLEKYLANPRHIEFQILADHHGNCMHLFERECSIQRRHQKIIEETPSVALTPELRKRMGSDAVRVAQTAGYTNAGTVEFLLDEDGHYYFLEMNTRIQVEHPITEMTTGIDLVVEQIRIAAGGSIEHLKNASQQGHAIECRIYAEDADNNFLPSVGRILYYDEPTGPGIRVDSGIRLGDEVSVNYDPIVAKLIVHAPDRATAISKMIGALHRYKILGVKTPKRFMADLLAHPEFAAGRTFTNFIQTNSVERVSARGGYQDLAVAVAAALASEKRRNGMDGNAGSIESPSPWQILGPFQIGDSIRD